MWGVVRGNAVVNEERAWGVVAGGLASYILPGGVGVNKLGLLNARLELLTK